MLFAYKILTVGVAKCLDGSEVDTEFEFDACVEIEGLDHAISEVSGHLMDWFTSLSRISDDLYTPNLTLLKYDEFIVNFSFAYLGRNLVNSEPTPEGEIYQCHLEPLPPIDTPLRAASSHKYELASLGRYEDFLYLFPQISGCAGVIVVGKRLIRGA